MNASLHVIPASIRDLVRLGGTAVRSCSRHAVPAFAGMAMLLSAVTVAPAAAQDSLPPAPYAYRQLDDPRLEAQAQALMETLRCLTCQSQAITDCDEPLAGDM